MTTSPVRAGLILLAACTLLAVVPASGAAVPASGAGVPAGPHPAARAVPGPALARLVEARRAVEQVYWRHRIWPVDNPGAKPSLGAVMTDDALRDRVIDGLRKSAALERLWGRRITPDQLQAEMDRMAADTKSPDVLRELFAALGNDPALIAETLARPSLVDRLIRNAYALDDRWHRATRLEAEARSGGEASETTYVREAARADVRESVRADDRGAALDAPPGAAPDAAPGARPADPREVVLGDEDWGRLLDGLAAGPGLQEDADRFHVSVMRSASEDRVVVASVSWSKRSFDDWWRTEQAALPAAPDEGRASYRLPQIQATACDDLWSEVHRALPSPRSGHTAVWTGTEMIVWGGSDGFGGLNTGDRYNPATDSWSRVRSDGLAPTKRTGHGAVWTGTEMIIWGGYDQSAPPYYLDTGGRYNPFTDTWNPTLEEGAPSGRSGATVVWTGTRMIVWGGLSDDSLVTDGGRYNPVADTWTPTRNDVSTPAARSGHVAVWTGTELIVWGGQSSGAYLNTGGRYNPVSDTWVATPVDASTPSSRTRAGGVWTGSEMVVWGGSITVTDPLYVYTFWFSDGARYDPVTNHWAPTATTNAPVAREPGGMVWTGSEAIVWGGTGFNGNPFDGGRPLVDGGRYNPATDSWTGIAPYPSALGPMPRVGLWTGSELIVWGGGHNHGGRYSPASDTWIPTFFDDTPPGRQFPTAVWTGSEMIVWGGFNGAAFINDGARYDPATDSWTRTRQDGTTPVPRAHHSAVWTGSEMIVWGGGGSVQIGPTGGRYEPSSDTWTPTGVGAGTPAALQYHTAVWTGTRMIVWGGIATSTSSTSNAGGIYNPGTDSWAPTRADATAPEGRFGHTAVWTGDEMIVWGGEKRPCIPTCGYQNTGGRYDPAIDTWVPTRQDGTTPNPRRSHSAVWTGTEMIVWGGIALYGGDNILDDHGGIYDPRTNLWRPTSTLLAPAPRDAHSAVWTGVEMIVWGGRTNDYYNTVSSSGGRFDPAGDSWTPTRDDASTPRARGGHSAVWTGSEMIVWGGGIGEDTGGRYCAEVPPDTDGDGIVDPLDNCLFVSNGGQEDEDFDHLGDACDNCPSVVNPGQENADFDQFGDACDNCPNVSSPGQEDANHDGSGDACQPAVSIDEFRYANPGRIEALVSMHDPQGEPLSGTIAVAASTDLLDALETMDCGRGYLIAGQPGEGVAFGMATIGETFLFDLDSTLGCDDGVSDYMLAYGPCVDGQEPFEPFLSLASLTLPATVCVRPVNLAGQLGPEGFDWRIVSIEPESATIFIAGQPPVIEVPFASGLPGAIDIATLAPSRTYGLAITATDGNTHPVTSSGDFQRTAETTLAFVTGSSSGPTAAIAAPASLECDRPAGASVTLDGSGSTDPDSSPGTNDDIASFDWYEDYGTAGERLLGSGETLTLDLSLGAHAITLLTMDYSGQAGTASTTVTVRDTLPPGLALQTDPGVLWPPNHSLVPVQVAWQTGEACNPAGVAVQLVSVGSSEPDDAPGNSDGATTSDIQEADPGTADASLLLRAERSGKGSGRVYLLTYRAVDGSGNTATAVASVTAPHDLGQGPEPLLLQLEPAANSAAGAAGARIFWPTVSGATAYDVITGDLEGWHVSDGTLDVGHVKALARGTSATSLTEPAGAPDPPVGHAFFYLIQQRTDRGPVGYGTESAPLPRVAVFCEGGCPGVTPPPAGSGPDTPVRK